MSEAKSKKVFHYPCSAWNPYNRIIKDGVERLGIKVILIEGRKAARRAGQEPPRTLDRMRQLMKEAAIIHFHWIGSMTSGKSSFETIYKSLLFMILISFFRLRGVKLVITLHNLLPHDKGHEKTQKLVRRTLLRFFDAVILHSRAALESTDRCFGIRNRSVVIPHPNYRGYYADTVTREEARARFGLYQERRVILFFGLLRPYKQIDTLLSMVCGPQALDDLVLIVAGMNRMGDHLSGIEGHGNLIVHDRFIPDEEVQYYFRCADCLVIPTSSPSALTSGAAALSITFETPIIARNHTPFQEFFQKGLGVPSEFASPHELYQAVSEIHSWDRQEFKERCQKYNDETCMQLVGKMHAQLYRQLEVRLSEAVEN